jgi:hypothetical protein
VNEPAQDNDDIPLLSKAEAIAEVRRWLEEEKVDPERIFSQMGDQIVRYKDLIAHLEQETPDGKLLRFSISRGRFMKRDRDRQMQAVLQILTQRSTPEKPPTS